MSRGKRIQEQKRTLPPEGPQSAAEARIAKFMCADLISCVGAQRSRETGNVTAPNITGRGQV
jgi:hypothetical protein